MNRLIIFMLVLGLIIGVSTDARAHLTVIGPDGTNYGNVFPLHGFVQSEIPTLDANLSDWEATVDPALWFTTEMLGVNDWWNNGAVYDLNNLAFRFALGWAEDTNRLYLGAEVRDNLYINEFSQRETYQSDCIEWMIDADHSGGPFACLGLPEEEEKRWRESQAQQVIINPAGWINIGQSAADPWVSVPPYMDMEINLVGSHKAGPVTFTYEAYATPWDDLNPAGPTESVEHSLEAGQIIHMQVNIADFDSFNDEGRALYWSYENLGPGGGVSTWNNADNQVDFLLTEPTKTAVKKDSWGEIKAMFGR
jgi:hypothetical protein